MARVLITAFFVTAWTAAALANTAPIVSNVSASQRTDGSGIVDISYRLFDAENDKCTVSVQVSHDGGTTWTITPTAMTGDVGANITTGNNKSIRWNSKLDIPGAFGDNFRIKVIADDGITAGPVGMRWVYISDPGFEGYMAVYETTNAQYAQFLNTAFSAGAVEVDGSIVRGANNQHTPQHFAGQPYYNLNGPGGTGSGATNGGRSRIKFANGSFTVDSGFENHPVTYVSWYGATAFATYYGWRLPTQSDWQAVANYNGSYTYGCGTTINPNKANYLDSHHSTGTTPVGYFGLYGYGLADMAGNVWEWTSTVHTFYPGHYRVFGGSWSGKASDSSISYTPGALPYEMSPQSGFRLCR